MKLDSTKGLMLAGVGIALTYGLLSRREKRGTKSSPKSPAPASPFVEGSSCTQLAEFEQVERWLKTVVTPVAIPKIEAFDVPPDEHEAARLAVELMVDEVFAATVPECPVSQTRAAREVWKWLWCEVVSQLVLRGKIDEEIDDVVRLCTDPLFDPRAPKPSAAEPAKTPGGVGPLPVPMPVEPMQGGRGPVPVEPPQGTSARAPNLWRASTREELGEVGVLHMMEGTAAGAPITGPSRLVVLLAASPFWPGLERARADMARLAVEHSRILFVEVSFADTQRHFGKPNDLAGIAWVLAAAGPDGRVFPTPIARHDPRDPAPSAEQWSKVIAHARGFVGSPRVRTIARPQHFGDLVRAMVRRRVSRGHTTQRKIPTRRTRGGWRRSRRARTRSGVGAASAPAPGRAPRNTGG